VGKAAKVLERVGPSVIAKFFVTTSVSLLISPPFSESVSRIFVEKSHSSSLFGMSRLIWGITEGITKPAIRRLARRGGVKRISGLIYEEVLTYQSMSTYV
jgi:hypothetical protein